MLINSVIKPLMPRLYIVILLLFLKRGFVYMTLKNRQLSSFVVDSIPRVYYINVDTIYYE